MIRRAAVGGRLRARQRFFAPAPVVSSAYYPPVVSPGRGIREVSGAPKRSHARTRPRAARQIKRATMLAVVFAACAQTPPRVQLDTVRAEAEANGRIAIEADVRNVGGSFLQVHEVRPSCGCRLRGGVPDALAPGAMATVALTCGAGEGTVARVMSSDPATPALAVLRPRDAPAAATATSGLYFGTVSVGKAVVRDLTTNGAAAAGATSSDAAFTIVPAAAGGVTVRFTPVAAGVVRGTLRLANGASVPLVGVGAGSLVAFPAELTLGVGRPATATVMAVGAERVPALAVAWPPGFAGEVREVEAGREYRLTARVVDADVADAAAVIQARTGDEVVAIPVVRLDG